MKAALITPLVSSFALTWKRNVDKEKDQDESGGYQMRWVFGVDRISTPPVSHSSQSQQLTQIKDQRQNKLTLKSSNTSIWFWMMGTVLRSFSVFMVLITPSDLQMEGKLLKTSVTVTTYMTTIAALSICLIILHGNQLVSSLNCFISLIQRQWCHTINNKIVNKVPVTYPLFTLVKSKATCL